MRGSSTPRVRGPPRTKPVKLDSAARFVPWWSQAQIDQGIANGSVIVSSHRQDEAYVRRPAQKDVFVGEAGRNRALHGDVVAVELLPESRWRRNFRHASSSAAKSALVNAAPVDAQSDLWLPTIPAHFLGGAPAAEDLGKRLGALKVAVATGSGAAAAADDAQPAGVVVAVLAANDGQVMNQERVDQRSQIGTLSVPKGRQGERMHTDLAFALFKPKDSRLPDLEVPRGDLPLDFVQDPFGSAASKLYEAVLDGWPDGQTTPRGRLVREVGQVGEIASETAALLVTHDVDHGEFPAPVLACLGRFLPPPQTGDANPDTWWQIPPAELAVRRDYRSALICTIDPLTAKDLDDALHCTPLPDGTFEVGVHIADVSYFVQPSSELDVEAARRCTTVYLVQKVIPMLPALLSEQLCSLNPGVDRLAFSCVWKMNRQGGLVPGTRPWYGRSVIRSAAKLDYGLAQRLIDNGEDKEWKGPSGGHSVQQVVTALRDLHRLGMARRVARFDPKSGGALALTAAKMSFELDKQTGNPVGVRKYQMFDTNQLVEEFMLLANYLVAQRLIEGARENAFLRHHPPPDPKQMHQVAQSLERGAGVQLFRGSEISAAELHMAMQRLANGPLPEQLRGQEQVRPDLLVLTSELLKKPMKPAQYFVSCDVEQPLWRHWALNIPYYTHFTSPIRRYADVCVHRELAAVLAGEVVEDQDRLARKTLHEIAERCNEKKQASRDAQEASDLVYLNVLVRDRFQKGKPYECDALVMDLGPKSFELLLPELGVSKRIHALMEWRAHSADPLLAEGDAAGEAPQATLQLTVKWSSGFALELKVLSRLRVKLVPKAVAGTMDFRVMPAFDVGEPVVAAEEDPNRPRHNRAFRPSKHEDRRPPHQASSPADADGLGHRPQATQRQSHHQPHASQAHPAHPAHPAHQASPGGAQRGHHAARGGGAGAGAGSRRGAGRGGAAGAGGEGGRGQAHRGQGQRARGRGDVDG